MMHHSLLTLLAITHILPTNAQTLLEALSTIPSLSNFTAFYTANAPFANTLFANSSLYPITVLVPNDNAFAAYQAKHGVSLTEVPPDILLPLVQYHTLVSSLSKENFTTSDAGKGNAGGSGITVPTAMVDQNNQRSVGTSLAAKYGGAERAKGQVVFIRPADSGSSSPSTRFLLSRQEGGGSSSSSIRSGLSSNVNLTALEGDQGVWDGGRFHIIDGLLTPPDLCKTTIRSAGLSSLDNALNRSGLWSALDGGSNLTCLGPSNEAFAKENNPDQQLSEEELVKALHFHTLPEVAYSDFLYDGQEFQSLENMTVRVRVEESEAEGRQIWFNNARVVDANVLAHNGLMHVLDAVMKPLEELDATSSASPTASATASNTAAATSNAALPLDMDGRSWVMLGVLGFVVVMEGLGVRG